jgi:thymidylate kinase
MSGGGTMIALVGGDGAGKSTAIAGLQRWLVKDFATRHIHFGKPPRALSTRLVRAAVRLTRFTSNRFASPKSVNATAIPAEHQESSASSADQVLDYGQLLLHVCTARDRYRAYVRARRFVNNGGIVIADRFPLPQIQRMEAPQLPQLIGNRARQPLLRWLLAQERAYYAHFQEPELLAILRLDPAVAVSRKPEEPAALVHRRSVEIWQADWSGSRAQLIDAAQPQEEVLATLKELVWAHL